MKITSKMAVLTIYESIQSKTLLMTGLLIIAAFIMAFIVSSVTMGGTSIFIASLGAGVAGTLLDSIAILIVVSSFYGDIEGRNLYIFIPLYGRHAYLLGKILGITASMTFVTVVLFVILAFASTFSLSLAQAGIGVILEMWVCIAIAALFSLGSNQLVAVILSFAIVISGHYIHLIGMFTGMISNNDIVIFIGTIITHVIPDMTRISMLHSIDDLHPIGMMDVFLSVFYGLNQFILLIILSLFIFDKKTLT